MKSPRTGGFLSLLCAVVVIFGPVYGRLLPSVSWDRYNPMLNNGTLPCRNRIKVKMNDKINVVCPNKPSNPIMLEQALSSEQLHNNLYFTTDAEAYRSCNSTNARKLLSCDDPNKLGFYTFMFRKTAPSQASLVFKEGETSYIFATADGTSQGQSNKVGGFCQTDGLKIEFYVCRNDEECSTPFEECKDIQTGGHVLQQRSEDLTFSDKLQDGSVVACLVGILLVGLFAGIIIGFMLNRIRKNRDSDSRSSFKQNNGSKATNGHALTETDSNENCSSRTQMV